MSTRRTAEPYRGSASISFLARCARGSPPDDASTDAENASTYGESSAALTDGESSAAPTDGESSAAPTVATSAKALVLAALGALLL